MDDGVAFEAAYLAKCKGVVAVLLIQLGFGFAVANAGHAFGYAGSEAGFFLFVVFVVLIVVVGSLDVDVTAGAEDGLILGDDVAAAHVDVLIAADIDLFAGDAAAYGFIMMLLVFVDIGFAGGKPFGFVVNSLIQLCCLSAFGNVDAFFAVKVDAAIKAVDVTLTDVDLFAGTDADITLGENLTTHFGAVMQGHVVAVTQFAIGFVVGYLDGVEVDAAFAGTQLGLAVDGGVDDLGAIDVYALFAIYCQDAVFVAGDI